jgi:hypothetical protein
MIQYPPARRQLLAFFAQIPALAAPEVRFWKKSQNYGIAELWLM